MLENLYRYENLGTPKYFHELLERLAESETAWTTSDISQYFHNRLIDGQSVFDGCIPFASTIGLVTVQDNGLVVPDEYLKVSALDERRLGSWILDRLLKKLKDDDAFLEIIRSENVSYDVIYQLIQIEKSAFPFKYAALRQLLITLDFIKRHPDERIPRYIVNSKYRRLFDSQLLPEIRKRKIGIDALKKVLERRQIAGLEAEEFVLKYEQGRLAGHPEAVRIERISDYDSNAGYDVISFEELGSERPDRFIEVKSYEDMAHFHWSSNEIAVSRIRRATYYLYLVDRKKMREPGYEPMVIRDPFENVFNNERSWMREATSWHFYR